MKRFIFIVISCAFVMTMPHAYSFAQTDKCMKDGSKGEMKQQCMKMDEGMMDKHQPMMKQIMADKQDMMQMMLDMMSMQEKMIKGPKAAEKKQMQKNMVQMKEKMQKMLSRPMAMRGMDDSQSKLTCAEPWLKKAIDLHEEHLKAPKTATESSRMEMMDQVKKAYDCITGRGSDMSGAALKNTGNEEPKKAEPLMGV